MLLDRFSACGHISRWARNFRCTPEVVRGDTCVSRCDLVAIATRPVTNRAVCNNLLLHKTVETSVNR